MPHITWPDPMLGFGAIDACAGGTENNYTVIHACKHPCHRTALQYKNTLPREHEHYLSLEKNDHLYLNLIDPPLPLFQLESFKIFFEFIDRHLHKKPVLIHCNKGESRAPSLTLLVLAKRMNAIPNKSYAAAAKAFAQRWPYKPGNGISVFLEQNWESLGA